MSVKPPCGLNIVSIGGGTGLSTLLAGLKKYVRVDSRPSEAPGPVWIESLAAVVTVTDDGGSSGRLRKEFQILPPGDIRNCLAALAEDERLLTRLFQYRFESDGELSGHSFGNIFLAALTGVTGDFLEAIRLTSEVLAIKGRIFPSTMEDVSLVAELENGQTVKGETNIVQLRSRIKRLWLSNDPCEPLPTTLAALTAADIITIGPGSLYTSIIPNLLVKGIVETIRRSEALKIYICNIMTQPGETEGFSVEDHIAALYQHNPDLELDYVVVNSTPISAKLRQKYLAEGSVQVDLQRRRNRRAGRSNSVAAGPGYEIISCDLLSEDGVVRHDTDKLTRLLLSLRKPVLTGRQEPAYSG
jgi:uncharacterized cofD-like protein